MSELIPATDDNPARIALDSQFVLPRRIAMWAASDPDRPFLTEVTGRSLTYGEVRQTVRRWCGWLRDHGVSRGARFFTMVPASIDAVCLWLAAGCLGALEIPVNPELRGDFLVHALTVAGASLCVVRPEFAPVVRESGVPGLRVAIVGRDADATAGYPAADPGEFPRPEDPACVIYASGTTGPAKGVVLSWAQFSATIGRIPRSWLASGDAVYCCHPMFHATGRTPLLSMADVGGRVVLREKFSARAFLIDVRRHECTTTTAYVPLLLAAPEQPDDADNPLRVVLASCGAAQARRLEGRFGVRVIECYGSTEAGFPLALRDRPDERHRWCGLPRRGYQIRVVGSNGAEVPDGEIGELWVRPLARPLLMLGYLDQPKATAAAITSDGWYRTGDAVIQHPGGHVEFVDRMRDTIRRHGENISSAAVEAVVAADPAVEACAVVGVPGPVADQGLLLAVVPTRPNALRPEELWLRVASRLPRSMRPAYIVVYDDLPRTPTNKIRKVGLLEQLDLQCAWRPRRDDVHRSA